jgi:hypothetical protein
VLTGDTLVSDYAQFGAFYEVGGSAIAYSSTSLRFLIVYQTLQGGIQARLVDVNGNPIGGVLPIANAGGSQAPGVSWNSATDEFGISYTGYNGSAAISCPAAFVGFVRLRAGDGFLFPRTTFACSSGTFMSDVSVNRVTHNYVMGWTGGGSFFTEFDASGNPTGNTGLVSTAFGNADNFALDWNQVSGTFLAVGQHNASLEIAGAELNTNGYPVGTASVLTTGAIAPGSFYPRVGARTDAGQWNISYSSAYTSTKDQVVSTSSANGGPSGPSATPTPTPTPTPTSGGCTTPNPFASMGAGVCVNGGWQFGSPAASPTPTPTPTPTPAPSAGCTTPNPFAAMGTGVCVNGGWQFGSPAAPPAPTPTPTPTPTPAPAPSGGCTTPNPFASQGMGQCINGGWQYLPMTSSTPTGPTLCNGTPDPFTTSGGGQCINGGWVPNNSLPTLCSGFPDPFTAIGGGVCINGGWVPRTAIGGRP